MRDTWNDVAKYVKKKAKTNLDDKIAKVKKQQYNQMWPLLVYENNKSFALLLKKLDLCVLFTSSFNSALYVYFAFQLIFAGPSNVFGCFAECLVY